MADPVSYGNPDRDFEQALIALKKGTQLIKYSRKGKPKFCPFRISPDETTLIWLSHGDERHLKLSSVSRIIPGQRTAVFRRYLRPEKDYLSFSLLYNNGERTLDLICKDKVEVEIWLAGLKALTSSAGHSRRTKSDISDLSDGGDFIQNNARPFGATLGFTSSIARSRNSVDSNSDAGTIRSNTMQLRTSGGDGFRISVSSTPSCSSQGSGPDDIESLGDVYVWGEVLTDGVLPDGSTSPNPIKSDILTPKPLESNVVLDVHQISCGVRHIGLVTRQGEVFTWGEENGGRLGHGIERDFSRPQLVEFLAVTNVEFVACGEYHTSAISTNGDLFTWGDGAHNTGLLGHGTDVSHWIPKRVSGPLEGLQVLSVSCGTWHTALATSNGKLFTFGDGTFGALGHGNRESFSYPKEVQQLCGLKTLKVACGLLHTAAIVEVMNQSGGNMSSRKLFTWGDGDKHRLGHGSKETYLVPTCVSTLIDYNFHQLACGQNMTVALTTSGHVFTMGGTGYGQLGNPDSDGKIPCLVQDKLMGEFVEEISCGAYHVAVLTSRSEVLTWGKGANGRLGHGDTEDRKIPTLVEALKDRHVKNISCGSNFTASICIHKWVSGADQSICSGCRQQFGFTRKRHNCYNCGLVHCHACSSKKALKAALAPTPGKPHRVCDSCFSKLKAAEAGSPTNFNRKTSGPRRSIDTRDRFDRGDVRSYSRTLLSPTIEPVKFLGKFGIKNEHLSSSSQGSQAPSLLQLKDIVFPSPFGAIHNALKPPITTPAPLPPVNSRPSSPTPYSRKPSPPRSVGPSFSRSVVDSLRKTNEVLNQEVSKLQNQVKSWKQRCDLKDIEIQKLHQNFKEAAELTAEQSSKCTLAKEVVESITTQLTEINEKLPPEVCESDPFRGIHTQAEAFLDTYKRQIDIPSDTPNTHDNRMSNDHVDVSRTTEISENGSFQENHASSISDTRDDIPQQGVENGTSSKLKKESNVEVTEQFEPGVYVTLVQLKDGTKIFKRVRFSKRRFAEQQAEIWWKENKDRLLKKYSPTTNSAPSGSSTNPVTADENSDTMPSSQA